MSRHDLAQPNADQPSAVPAATTVVLVASIAAAWIAAGSTGLLAHPLRHALTWMAVGVAIVAGWPRRDEPAARWLTLGAAAVLGLLMTAVAQPAVNVLAVTLVTAALVRPRLELRDRVVLVAALATAVLAVFRLAADSSPVVWLAADGLGRGLGWLAGIVTGWPLWLGASFGGVDFLVLMAALYAGWLCLSAPPRLPRAIYAAVAILAGHLIYLAVLSFSNQVLSALPAVVLPPQADNSRLGVWAWGNAVRTLVPWNLPMLALLIHAAVATAMFRWAAWLPVAGPQAAGAAVRRPRAEAAGWIGIVQEFGPVVLALAIAPLSTLSLNKSELRSKSIVANLQGFIDWDRPQYDAPATGMFGMLEMFGKSLGGKFFKSADLSQKDLAEADVLLLLHPNQDWSKDRETLEGIWQFVRGGGSLLVAAGPEMQQGGLRSTFNDVLGPTAMRVRRDTAISATPNWEQACQPLAHPVTAGIDDRRNRFGLAMASSIEVRWPARPLLVGRWAWSEPGSDALRTGAAGYAAGEKLGDLVLAAEQPLGQGTVVVLGDTSPLHNDVLASSYPFAGRLLGYLAGRRRSPQAWWRQLVALTAMVTLVGLLAWQARPLRTAVAAAVLAGSLTACAAVSQWQGRVLPGIGPDSPKLACIDASHLEAYSSDTWGNFGIAGFARNLARCGYLPLLLPELNAERLKHAELLVSIGPARRFSGAQRKAVRGFVEEGGTFICMVGAEEAPASEDLLADFDLRVPSSPVPPGSDQREPAPLGPFSRTIEHQGSKIRVRSFAAWKVEHGPKGGWTEWVRGTDEGVEQPFVVSRRVGRGQVVVIGDTLFATNRHLESPVSMIPENVVFWRWLLTHVTDLEDWVPPPPEGARGGLPEEGAPAAPPAGDATAPPTDSTPAVPDTLPKLPDELPPEDPAADDPASDEVGP